MSSNEFVAAINAWTTATERRVLDAFVFCTEEVRRSVVEGSALTGAPGQPVDTGALRSSWIGEFQGALVYELTTKSQYAPYIEDGGNARGRFRPPGTGIRLRNGRNVKSTVGGFHSVKLTTTSWPVIVRHAVRKAGGPS